jgi:hypothetical protein
MDKRFVGGCRFFTVLVVRPSSPGRNCRRKNYYQSNDRFVLRMDKYLPLLSPYLIFSSLFVHAVHRKPEINMSPNIFSMGSCYLHESLPAKRYAQAWHTPNLI